MADEFVMNACFANFSGGFLERRGYFPSTNRALLCLSLSNSYINVITESNNQSSRAKSVQIIPWTLT